MRMIKQAKANFGDEAAFLVLRAYTAGLRDGAAELLLMSQDISREFESVDLDKLDPQRNTK